MRSRGVALLTLLVTAVATWLVTTGLGFKPDVADMLPDAGQGEARRQFGRVFGGGDLALVLVRGEYPDEVQGAAQQSAERLRAADHVHAVVDNVRVGAPSDPTKAWAVASPPARSRLAQATTPEGMLKRLAETRALLLSPGAAALADAVRRDPLRLAHIPFEQGVGLGSGATARPVGALRVAAAEAFVACGGKARLLLVAPEGQALRGDAARAFVQAAEMALTPVRDAHPNVRIELTGGHAIAAASERMIRRDLWLSGVLSAALASLAFALTFRRLRALLAVLAPLAIGTLWTCAVATVAFAELSAITVAFVAVVVGVGVDTGIHVYAALLEGRRSGLSAQDAAARARRETARPTLVAATAAAAAFGSLGLSSIPALRQFGWLCAVGELLTALAILALTPSLGAWLERGPVPARRIPAWVRPAQSLTRSHLGPALLAIGCFVPAYVLFTLGPPRLGDAIVAVRPDALEPLRTHDDITQLFGGGKGQWVVLVQHQEPDGARTRADWVFEALAGLPGDVEHLDGLARFAPSPALQRARLQERSELALPARGEQLRAALEQVGFAPEQFEPALAAFRTPSNEVRDALESDGDQARLLRARFLGRDDGNAVAAVYVRPRQGHEQAVEHAILTAVPEARITGYGRLEATLREGLTHDLPRITLAASLLIALVLATSLRRWRDALLAGATLALEVAWVLAAVRWLDVPLHAYSAIVLPVLLGITVDEAMFLLHHVRRRNGSGTDVDGALAVQGPNVVATALTTAAGFAALGICAFDGLRDMAAVGVTGSVAGLVAALLVVPIGARLLRTSG